MSAEDKETTAAESAGGPARNPRFPVGVDCYPLNEERRSWSDWYDRDVEAEFEAMARAGLSLVRFFISWRAFEQQVGQYDSDAEERLEHLIVAAAGAELKLIVCFFADDRLAEMNDVVWGKGRNAHTDDYLLQRQLALVQRIVTRYRTEPAIWAWELGNEAFLADFSDERSLESWAAAMREAVREIDPERPVLLGADVETLYRASGVDARVAIDQTETAIAHSTAVYRAYAAEGPVTRGPATYLDSFLLRSAARDLPVLLDGVGTHSLDFSAVEEAAHLRSVLYQAFMNGASGVVLRRWRDLSTERREPYYRDPYEILVGLTDEAGEPKPALAEVRRFVATTARVDLRSFARAPERCAVLMPAERYEPLPSLAGLYAARSCLQAYVAAKEAHLSVAVTREGARLAAYGVIFVPSAAKLAAETWRELASFVTAGGAVVLSYGGGDVEPAVREIFGVDPLGDGGVRDGVSCRVAQPGLLGDLSSFDVRLTTPHHALLGPGNATVVATDATGNPLLTLNQYGQGRAIFLAAPLERAIAQSDPHAAPEPVRAMLRTVYGAVARAAGVGPAIECDQPDAEVALFAGDGEDIVFVLSHHPEPMTATLTCERTVASVSGVRGGAPAEVGAKAFGVPLAANGAAALRLTYE